ncbi:MAG: hypothetical protein ACHQNT_03035 [Bacteroidia bacterium]
MKTTFKFSAIVALVMLTTRVNSQDWSLTGNAATNPSVNFIGTTDNHSFVIRSNNANRIFVDSTGKVGIGTSTPTFHLQFTGGKFNLNATSTTASSLIKSKYKIEIQNGTTSTTFATFDAINQRVGIGTTTPTTPLDVNGIITATGGNSTNWNSAFGWGNHAAAGYLTSYTETDPQVGSNTLSRLPRWDGSALSTGTLFDNGTRVAIGTAAPLFSFNVYSSTELRSVYVENSTSSASTTYGMYAGALGAGSGDKRGGAFDAINGTGNNMAVRGFASGSASSYGLQVFAQGTGTNYAVWGSATGGATNYAAFFSAGNVLSRGNMMVSNYSTPSTYKLEVRGDSTITSNVIHSVSNYQGTFDTRAINGHAINAPGYGYGVTGTGGYMGVRGDANATTYSSYAYGVYGSATGSAGIRIGVYGTASGGATNWAGYFSGNTYISSSLMVGTTTPATGYLVSVAGKMICTEMKVQLQANWPDYVFNENYKLPSLAEVKNSIEQHKHLPGLPSAAEIEKENGFEVGDMQTRLVKKVEELTLYILQQQTEIEKLKTDNLKMHNDIASMKK